MCDDLLEQIFKNCMSDEQPKRPYAKLLVTMKRHFTRIMSEIKRNKQKAHIHANKKKNNFHIDSVFFPSQHNTDYYST